MSERPILVKNPSDSTLVNEIVERLNRLKTHEALEAIKAEIQVLEEAS